MTRPFGYDFRFFWDDAMNPIWADDTDDACRIASEMIMEYLIGNGVHPDDVIDLGIDRTEAR